MLLFFGNEAVDAFKLWCWRRLLRVPWTARRSNQSILREISPGISLEGLMLKLKLQYFGHLMWRVDSLEKTVKLGGIGGSRRRGRLRMRCLDGILDSMDVSLSELREMVMDREAWRAVIHGVAKRRTRLSNWTELNWTEVHGFIFWAFYLVAVQFSSVVQSWLTLCNPMAFIPGFPVHHQLLELTKTCPLSPWCHPAISSSVVPFSSCPQSLPASESFPMSQLFTWGGQSTGASASVSFLPKKSQGWSSSEWTVWISLQSKGLSRVFSNTTVQKHQFFSAQPSSQSNSHIHTWLLEKP